MSRVVNIVKEPYRILRRSIWKAESKISFRRYADTSGPHLLQIGAGTNPLNGWFNVDMMRFRSPQLRYMDATKTFPFPNDSFDGVFSEHMIEHITFDQALFMSRESFRVLKKGGLVRISTPDLETLASLYVKRRTQTQREYIHAVMTCWQTDKTEELPGFVINQLFGFGHAFLYDFATLKYLLQRAGFSRILRGTIGKSNNSFFDGIDAYANDYIAFETLVVEAEKH